MSLITRMRSIATDSEDLRMNSADHERAIAEAKERRKNYSTAYHAHKDKIRPEVEKIAAKRGITPPQAAKFHSGYPALKTLNHLRATAQVEHENALKHYENYKARKQLPKAK